jgi:hypothetical protein
MKTVQSQPTATINLNKLRPNTEIKTKTRHNLATLLPVNNKKSHNITSSDQKRGSNGECKRSGQKAETQRKEDARPQQDDKHYHRNKQPTRVTKIVRLTRNNLNERSQRDEFVQGKQSKASECEKMTETKSKTFRGIMLINTHHLISLRCWYCWLLRRGNIVGVRDAEVRHGVMVSWCLRGSRLERCIEVPRRFVVMVPRTCSLRTL